MPSFFVKGSGAQVTLTDKDFVAKGGEKTIYAKSGTAYCVYHDFKNVMPAEKIAALSELTRPEVIRPLSELLDHRKVRCGETMPFVTDSYAPQDHQIRPMVLCQLFTNAFRRKQGIDNSHVARITNSILSVVRHCHDHGVILVDPNETNWLVDHKLGHVYLIDTSCVQTKQFPGMAIKPAIRDYTRKGFDEQTDWFSIAVVLGWLWVGIHPYLAHHPAWAHMDANSAMIPRMEKSISFFEKETEFNRACRSLDDIPTSLRNWLEAVLQGGQRIDPPMTCDEKVVKPRSAAKPKPAVTPSTTGDLVFEEIHSFHSDILGVFDGSCVFDLGAISVRTKLKSIPIHAFAKDGKLILFQTDVAKPIEIYCDADSVFESNGTLYTVSPRSRTIGEVVFNEVSKFVRATVKSVGSIADLPTTRTYRGCVFQNLLGKYLVTVFSEAGRSHQYQLPELESWQVLDAKYERGVLCVMAEKSGQYQMRRYRLHEGQSDTSVIFDFLCDVNFAVTDTGNWMMVDPRGFLLAAKNKPNSTVSDLRFKFPMVDLSLASHGNSLLGFLDNKLYKISKK